ncbi:phosphate/phosphite/phosphonate ABC transporter substrate-binding protein [Duganella sp. FT134W]|uniref:Phosphate/phosphite/phosphonate ABC transporter substrate-binding protein n=1 Tax=Duganella margarita TaxID=2692170 RepID=A0A7X4GZ13_9BURK|nr:phosphate/phosphite/phosphonate ABC transporter substrate-binding protein [Duganella margarita]MYM72312.1 phosphate/phosphite/phosphonate ABC transporter substrate-binding protein [Duganella margarita]
MTIALLHRAFAPLLLLAWLWLHATAAVGAECENPAMLRMSIIPSGDLKKDMLAHQPLLQELRAALGIPVEVYAPPSYGAVAEGLLSGAIQLARMGPASYVAARKADPQLTPFASFEHKANAYQPAGAFYHSLLIVRADSGIGNIAAVRGKRLALVDPQSTSGALIPRQVFAKQAGQALESYFGQIGYTGSHVQSINRVLDGRVDAAFVASVNLAAVLSDPAAMQKVRVIWRSQAFPLDPFVYRGQLCEAVKKKIRSVFLKNDGARRAAVLENIDGVRFVPISDRDYQPVRDIY